MICLQWKTEGGGVLFICGGVVNNGPAVQFDLDVNSVLQLPRNTRRLLITSPPACVGF